MGKFLFLDQAIFIKLISVSDESKQKPYTILEMGDNLRCMFWFCLDQCAIPLEWLLQLWYIQLSVFLTPFCVHSSFKVCSHLEVYPRRAPVFSLKDTFTPWSLLEQRWVMMNLRIYYFITTVKNHTSPENSYAETHERRSFYGVTKLWGQSSHE